LSFPGIWDKSFSAEVSGGFLEPGTELLEPFGQKECRSPGAGSRRIFVLEIGPGKFPGVTLNPPIGSSISSQNSLA
jgi:hypothetical protein